MLKKFVRTFFNRILDIKSWKVNTLSKKSCVEMFPEWEPFQNNYFNKSLIYKNKEYWVSEEDEGMFIWDKSKHIVTKVKANTSLNKGLQENLIHNIKKDRDGFAWILSNNTIAKYDMEADTVVELFKYHSKSKQLNSGIYFDMYHDGSNLWFATYGGGLNILNKKSRRWS